MVPLAGADTIRPAPFVGLQQFGGGIAGGPSSGGGHAINDEMSGQPRPKNRDFGWSLY
jgi:hypothetical protein